ncbi:MAG TPA: glycogen debranching enzyme N-terminal domain-containing protein, partial [Terriglobales bacterium]|nr:glycogen debranching enzyme N-terminal domain-containing protein [Terriglobales bacterium]
MISFGREVCSSLETASEREWLETNGLGGYASSTIIGLNTRRYHGLLVAPLTPPGGRFVLLSKLEEVVEIGVRQLALSVNQYPGAVHPQGFQHLVSFRLDPFPIFTFRLGNAEIEKSVFMVQGENTTVVQYSFRKGIPCESEIKLRVRPLIAFRDYHSTTHQNDALDRRLSERQGLVAVQPYVGLGAMHFAHDA